MRWILRKVRGAFEVRRLRKTARTDATPRSTERLCKVLDQHGREGEAVEEARRGLARFPHAHVLEDFLRKCFDRRRPSERARDASREQAFTEGCESIRAFLDFAKLDDAARAARDLAASFPDELEALLLQGRTHKALFERDHASRDGVTSLDGYRRAVEVSAASLEARRGLAEMYALIGATGQAVFHLLLALEIDGTDPAANRLYYELRRRPLSHRSETDLLWEAEVHDAPLVEKRDLASDRAYNARLVEGVKHLSAMKGVRRVAMRHKGVAMVASGSRMRPASEQSDPFLATIEQLRKGSSTWAKRVGMGGFEEATLALSDAVVFAAAGASTVLALELGPEADIGWLTDEARNIVASWTANEYRDLEWVR